MKTIITIILVLTTITFSCKREKTEMPESKMDSFLPDQVEIGGLLGKYIEKSEHGRLSHFIVNEQSASVQIFLKEIADKEKDKNWQGEHAGKWLYAASRAANRSGNKELEQRVKRVADFLISQQRKNGYLGTYCDSIRFYFPSEINQISWDVWVNSYMITGLIEVYRQFGGENYLNAAKKIGDLFIDTFKQSNIMIAHASYHHGMVGIGSMGTFVDLYEVTGEQKYLDFACLCANEIEQREGLELISRAIKGYDVSEIGNGKIYEMLRVLTGLARLYAHTGEEKLFKACEAAWTNIKENHLSPAGGPWGGVGKSHHLECFNYGYTFSPYGYVETCSTMSWIQFNSVMLKITSDPKYADQLEKTIYNSLLAKMFQDGEHWIYHSRPNGIIRQATERACCSSSGTIALEEIAPIMYTRHLDRIYVNIFGNSSVEYKYNAGGKVRIIQETKFPYDGSICLKFEIEKKDKCYVDLFIHIPKWAEQAAVSVMGVNYDAVPGEYAQIKRHWKNGDEVKILLPMKPALNEAVLQYDYKGNYLDKSTHFFNFQYGTLSLANSICDTDSDQNSLLFVERDPLQHLKLVSLPGEVTTFTFDGIADTTLVFQPYFIVGDMQEGACRTSWIRWEK